VSWRSHKGGAVEKRAILSVVEDDIQFLACFVVVSVLGAVATTAHFQH